MFNAVKNAQLSNTYFTSTFPLKYIRVRALYVIKTALLEHWVARCGAVAHTRRCGVSVDRGGLCKISSRRNKILRQDRRLSVLSRPLLTRVTMQGC
jgi:hypothetical protein